MPLVSCSLVMVSLDCSNASCKLFFSDGELGLFKCLL